MQVVVRTAGCVFLVSLGLLFGQGPTLVGSGYSNPSLIFVAPGQITTLFVTGLKPLASAEAIKAASLPLPTTLGGISITITQSGRQPLPVPLLSVQQLPMCSNGDAQPPVAGLTPECLITAITVQVPFELVLPPDEDTAELAINDSGSVSKSFRVFPVSSNLHVLNACDAFPSERGSSCGGIVTHADGTPVTSESPAKAGETVVVYAFGLGHTTPAMKTGDATITAAPTLASTVVAVQFDFRPNARGTIPYVDPKFAGTFHPAWVGLTPGQVGLYQINVTLPESLPVTLACSTSLGIASNLTINIATSTSSRPSFDGAPICVEPSPHG